MSPTKLLPQWPPRAPDLSDLSLDSRGGDGSSIDQILRHQLKFETTTTHHSSDRRQQRQLAPEHPTASESVLGVPIFRGDCWDVPEAEDGQDDWETCSSQENSLTASGAAAAEVALQASAPGARTASAGGGADSSSGSERRTVPSIRPALCSGPGSGNSENSMRVRFAPEVEALGEAATTSPPPPRGVAASGWGEKAPLSIPAAGRERQEEEVYVSPDGQCFVRRRNGMHTAWRRRRPVGHSGTSIGNRPRSPPRSAVAVGASSFDGTADSPAAVHTDSRSGGVTPNAVSGRQQAASADQLITLSVSSPARDRPPRLFLRRTRNDRAVSTRSLNKGREGQEARADAGPILRARRASNVVGGAGVRRTRDASSPQQTFPLPWTGPHLRTGADGRDAVRRDRRDGDEMGGGRREGQGGPLEALTTPPSPLPPAPPRSCGGWAHPASTLGAHKQQLAQQQFQPYQQRHAGRGADGSSARSPHRRPTAASRRSPRAISTGANVDENTYPPSPGRSPSAPALLSSASVRQNLARVARRSKVGTTADPVTLYRQRQELEQTRVKRAAAAARSREKAMREARGVGWGEGRAPGYRVVSERGGRTRGGSAVLGRAGMSLR